MSTGYDLAGRRIGVTGGGGHLGSAMALALAGAGATVLVVGRTEEALHRLVERSDAERLRGRIVAHTADVSTDAGLMGALDALAALAGEGDAIDGWVNNAYDGGGGLLGGLDRHRVEEGLARGLSDVIMATQAAAARMRDGGAIVNIASMYGIVSPQPEAYRHHPAMHNPPVYGAAKAGVIAFTRYAAVHLSSRGIRVNAVSPGPFPAAQGRAAEGFVAELEARVPLGRIGEPHEVGGAVVFLLSDAASYVTGHNLVVDGGWTAW